MAPTNTTTTKKKTPLMGFSSELRSDFFRDGETDPQFIAECVAAEVEYVLNRLNRIAENVDNLEPSVVRARLASAAGTLSLIRQGLRVTANEWRTEQTQR